MRKAMKYLAMAALAGLAVLPGEAVAQQGGAGEGGGVQSAQITLVYEREVYVYNAAGRRDPFRPLTGEDEMGPRFEELTLQGIIYATGRGRSVALIRDSSGRIHRARAGDLIGNSRVIEIGPARVIFAVENFGNIRQEMLELPTRGGAVR